MTPSQLLPPVKPSEAVAIADLVLRLVQGRPWTADLRAKLQSSLPTLRLEKLRVLPQTLAPDPTHGSTFYVIVKTGEEHWLLHFAPASAATTPLFPKPILLARVRPSGEREIVVNAIPVEGNVQTIVQGLHPNLITRPTSLHSLWSWPAEAAPEEFLARVPKRAQILPAFRATESSWLPHQHILLSQWREGFVAILEKLRTPPSAAEAEPFSRFSMVVDDVADARRIANFDQALKGSLRRGFDFEIDLSGHEALEIETLQTLLDNLKLLGCAPQSVELHPRLDFGTLLQARQMGMTLEVAAPGEAMAGLRMHWKLSA